VKTPFPAYRGSEPYVFACYSHANSDLVYPELERIRALGINVCYDEGISPGGEWTQEIADAIDSSHKLVFFVSPSSVASRHCRNEIQYALERKKPVISVHLEPTELPGGLQLSLGTAQAIVKYELSGSDYQRKLSESLSVTTAAHGHVGTPKPPRRRMPWRAFAGLVAVLALIVSIFELWPARDRKGEARFDRSLAVTRFLVSADDRSLGAIATDFTDELRGRLANYHEIRLVHARVAQLGGPDGAAVDASYVVSGSIQSSGGHVVVLADLVRARDKEVVASERIERPIAEFRGAGAEVLSRAIRVEVVKDHECETIRRRARSVEAAELICRGFAEFYQATRGRGSDPLLVFANASRAVQLDPQLVEGYHLLVSGYMLMSSAGEMAPEQAYEQSKSALRKAYELDPDNASTLSEEGMVESLFSLNWEKSDQLLSRAIALDPLHPHAHAFHHARAYAALGRGDAALAVAHCERALKLNDADGRTYVEYARALNSVGQHEDAINAARAGIELLPSGYWRALLTGEIIFAESLIGAFSEMHRELDAAFDAIEPQYRMLLADSFAMAGELDRAKVLLAQIESTTPSRPTFEVWANLALGKLDEAFAKMPSAIDRHEGLFITTLRAHPRWNPMRQDPRWQSVMQYLRKTERRDSRASDSAFRSGPARPVTGIGATAPIPAWTTFAVRRQLHTAVSA